MSAVVLINNVVAGKILNIRGQQVILDSDIAAIYDVETRDINKAVKNNPDKFPNGYIIELTQKEKFELVENLHRFENLKHSTVLPKAFTEKSLYMLATILKSPVACTTTLSIIETFAKVREIKREVISVFKAAEEDRQPTKIINRIGKLVGDLIVPEDNELETISVESEAEFKFMGIIKLTKRTIQKPKK